MHCSNSPLIVLAFVLTTFNILFSGVPPVRSCTWMPVAPSSLLGMTTYLPPGKIMALHPYVMHQQGIPPLPSYVLQSHVGNFHSVHTSAKSIGCRVPASSKEGQELKSVDKNYLSSMQTQQSLHQTSS
ncbi:hypothetical protein P3S68_024545 [Capsicum galapagoense]